MDEIIDILKNSSAIYLATVDKENRPNNRPVALALAENKTLCFSTSNETSIFADLQNNPFASITVMTPGFVWVRINAQCSFTEDINLKAKVLKEKEFLMNTFKNPENPKYKLFYLKSGTATIYDYSGNPPKSYNF